jgi:hypothetical protein
MGYGQTIMIEERREPLLARASANIITTEKTTTMPHLKDNYNRQNQ